MTVRATYAGMPWGRSVQRRPHPNPVDATPYVLLLPGWIDPDDPARVLYHRLLVQADAEGGTLPAGPTPFEIATPGAPPERVIVAWPGLRPGMYRDPHYLMTLGGSSSAYEETHEGEGPPGRP